MPPLRLTGFHLSIVWGAYYILPTGSIFCTCLALPSFIHKSYRANAASSKVVRTSGALDLVPPLQDFLGQ